MTHSRTPARAAGQALVALVLLVSLTVITPIVLWRTVGWPLPRSLPTWESLARPISDDVLVNGLTVVWWAAWAQLVVCLAAEVMAYIQGRRTVRLPGSAMMQRLASWLVTSMLMVGSSPVLRPAALPLTALPIAHREPVVASAVAAGNGQGPGASLATDHPSYTVGRRDTLWGIAARHLGDPLRWREIFELNEGRRQDDGGALSDPRRLQAGWILVMPTNAVGLDAGTSPSTVVVARGDTLSELAERNLGEDERWAEIFELNRNRPQPDGGALIDPDVIRPGWTLSIPTATTQPPPPAPAAPAPPPTEVNPPGPGAPAADAPPATPVPAHPTSQPNPPEPAAPAEKDGGPSALVGILGLGLAASGVVLTLDQLRRARLRHRPPGRLPAPPNAEAADAERSLRLVAEEQRPDVDRLDLALRAFGAGLAERGRPVPSVLALQFGPEGLELLLGNPSKDPPPGFTAQDEGWLWTIPADRIDGLRSASDHVAPMPALVTVGEGEAGTILVDLETAGSLELIGDRDEARRLLASFALELATSTWADHVDVLLVGHELPDLGALHRVRHVATIDEVIDTLEDSTGTVAEELASADLSSTLAARSLPSATEAWSPTVVLCSEAPADPQTAGRLAAIGGNGGRGVAVVVAGGLSGARWSFTCEQGVVAIAPLNLRARTAAPPEEDLAAVELLLDNPEGDASYETDQPDLEALVPKEPGPGTSEPDVVAMEDGRGPSSPAPPFEQGTCEVEVRVLGPLEIVGTEQPVEPGKPAEILVYLATHPAGVDSDRLRTTLWPRHKTPAPKTFANAISVARKLIGARHLPHATGDRYRLAPTVTTDLARFEAVARQARRQPDDDAVATLRAALELVRGAPFHAVHGLHWAQPEGLVAHAEALIVDAAHRLVELCLKRDDPAGADWAARQGLLASPGNEALFRDRMLAADAAGNPAAVEAVMDELCDFIDGGNPYETLHPETLATYERLSRRRLQRAGFGAR
jgi:hypothetical protein